MKPMAFVVEPVVKISISFRDRDQNNSSFQYNVPTSLTFAEIQVGALAVGAAAALISDATFTGYSVSTGGNETAPALAIEGSDVERKGSFTFIDAGNRPSTIQVPSISNSKVTDRTQEINQADAAVAAFIAAFTTGALLTARPTSVTGVDFDACTRAKKIHRKSSKG